MPDKNSVKNKKAKQRAIKLKRNFFEKYECCVVNNETYVLGDFLQLPGQEYYVAVSRDDVEEQYRTKNQTKVPKKFLIWQVICTCGGKTTFFVISGTINSNIYVEECLQQRLLHFL